MNKLIEKLIKKIIHEMEIDKPFNDGEVTFSDCVKLNNKPPKDGCSVGAIDNVVKIEKNEK